MYPHFIRMQDTVRQWNIRQIHTCQPLKIILKVKILLAVQHAVPHPAIQHDIGNLRLMFPIVLQAVLHGLCSPAVKILPGKTAVKRQTYIRLNVIILRVEHIFSCAEFRRPVGTLMKGRDARSVHNIRAVRVLPQSVPVPVILLRSPKGVVFRKIQTEERICHPKGTLCATVILKHGRELPVKPKNRHTVLKHFVVLYELQKRSGIDPPGKSGVHLVSFQEEH